MSKPVTNCEGCVFVETDGENQKGCKLQRPILLGVDTEDKHYTLERFCNTYRPSEWLSDLSFAEQMTPVDTVLNEVRPRLGFFVVLNTSAKDAISELRTTIDSNYCYMLLFYFGTRSIIKVEEFNTFNFR